MFTLIYSYGTIMDNYMWTNDFWIGSFNRLICVHSIETIISDRSTYCWRNNSMVVFLFNGIFHANINMASTYVHQLCCDLPDNSQFRIVFSEILQIFVESNGNL